MEKLGRHKHFGLFELFVGDGNKKGFMTLTSGPNVINLFCPRFTIFCKVSVFVPDKLFESILTNALAYYKNSYITDVKSFITLTSG